MQNAEIYSKHNKSTPKYKLILEILKNNAHFLQWRPEERVLDVGCGPGDVTVHVLYPILPSDFRLLLGIDISSSMIDFARKDYARNKVAFHVLDIATDISLLSENNEFSEGFDKIFSFFVLNWIQDLRNCIVNIHTLLRSGGQAVLFFPVDRYLQRTYQHMHSSEQWKEYFKGIYRKMPSFPSSDAKSEFEHLALSAGFEVQKCEVDNMFSEYESIDDFKGLVESMDRDVKLVPKHLKSQYIDDCVETIRGFKSLQENGGRVFFKQSRLLCILRKL